MAEIHQQTTGEDMFAELERINARPGPFEFYTAEELWNDEYTSQRMLEYHLNEEIDVSSRRHGFIERSVEWIIAHFDVAAGTKIADFGCGPGLYASRLAQRGADVTGIDFSKRSIEYATQEAAARGLSIRYVNRNYLDFECDDRFQLITMIMCDFCALSPAQRGRMLEKFHSLLDPGGAVLLDVYSLNALRQREEVAMYAVNLLDGFWAAETYFGFLNTFKYEEEKVTLDKYTIVERSRTRTVYNWLQHFTREMLEREFAECGFGVEAFFADVAGAEYDAETAEFAVVAKRR